VDALDELRTYVKTLPEGRITDAKVKLLISHCWDLLEGSSDHSMNMFKVHRAEDLMFNPPATILFNIERHGQTVQGSIYASVQKWQINLIEGTATSNPFDEEKRIVGKRDAPLKVNPIAEKVVNDIVNLNKKSEYLQWKSDRKVRILIQHIIPETVQQTTTARRRRFREKLKELLTSKGWNGTTVYYVYEKEEST